VTDCAARPGKFWVSAAQDRARARDCCVSEAIADSTATGEIFSYPVRRTWEFTSDNPIRSVFPLWPVYGLPMLLLRWLWIGNGNDGEIPPIVVFWTLRVLMFIVGFVLEDWAIDELIQSQRQRHRHLAMLLVASSYTTWTYQTHTFSNSIETLVVAWSLVLIERIVASPVSASE
jgi:GPI mannosyltransferase 4